jgi:hypothetical protein
VAVYQRVTGKLEFRMIRGYIMCIYSWTGLQISDLRLWVQFSASTGKTHILWVQLPFPWVTPFFVGNSLVSLHSSTNWIKKKDVFFRNRPVLFSLSTTWKYLEVMKESSFHTIRNLSFRALFLIRELSSDQPLWIITGKKTDD